MQIGQFTSGDAGLSDLHARARARIQHPRRYHRDDARRHFDVNEVAASAPLTMVPPQTAPAKRMPPIVNDDIFPGMGRMTLEWPSGAGLGCSVAPIAVVSAPR